MRHFKQVIGQRRIVPTADDGTLLGLAIDQFPVRPENIDCISGFPMNDVAVLLRASTATDSSRFEAVASRLRALNPEGTKNKPIAELWKDWRPSWCQSPAEIKSFVAWYNKTYPEDAVTTTADTASGAPAETSSDSVESTDTSK